MVTMLLSLGQVQGALIGLIGLLLSALLWIAFCFCFKRNRQGKKAVWLSLLTAEVICDGVWRLYYYPHGDYVNHGLAGMGAILIWPLLLAIAFFAVMAINGKKG